MRNAIYLLLFLFCNLNGQNNSVVGKVICGYQGWFNCYGDGSPVERWKHWSTGSYQSNTPNPSVGNITFEAFPDISIYKSTDLFQTGLADTYDGSKTKLFSSYRISVIDTHFTLMKRYNIDGVAIQRFVNELSDGVFKAHRDSVSARAMRAAEKNGRIFYIMYDISGLTANQLGDLKTDWTNEIVGKLKLTSSSAYAVQNNKVVVCIWGLGFSDRPGNASQSLDLINWFKNQGCYVIGGVPTNWRTCTNDSKVGFEEVYKAFDMISPWSVGRFNDLNSADNFKSSFLIPDQAYCSQYNMDYQPVVFPGFAWSNWNGGNKNLIPRLKGDFFWKQLVNISQSNISSMYVAMFDEYDEATAILNIADSYYMLPTNQYFLTTSADGTYLSSDFYLRLVEKATKVIHKSISLSTTVDIPYSVAPLFLRTGVEQYYDATPNWTSTIDQSADNANITNAICGTSTDYAHIGNYSIKCAGSDNSSVSSHVYFKVFDVNIPVDVNTYLSFWVLPQNNLSRFVSLDFVTTDGKTLRDCGATDTNGISMHPGAGRGTINQWTKMKSNIGAWLNGKIIDRIMIAYDNNAGTGNFTTYFDDIWVYNENSITTAVAELQKEEEAITSYPNPAKEYVEINSNSIIKKLEVYTSMMSMLGAYTPFNNTFKIDLKEYDSGIYILKIQTETGEHNIKVIKY